MGRAPCCSKVGLHRGPWTSREDALLTSYIQCHGEGNWRSLPKNAGLLRCGKSCRLRWMNYLRPDIKRGNIGPDEEDLIIRLHSLLGNRWSLIAGRLPGRTDNEIKNYWNSHLSKKLKRQGVEVREGGGGSKDSPRRRAKTAQKKNGNKNQLDKRSKKNNTSTTQIDQEDQEDPPKTKIHAPKPTRFTPTLRSPSTGSEQKTSVEEWTPSTSEELDKGDMSWPDMEIMNKDDHNLFFGGSISVDDDISDYVIDHCGFHHEDRLLDSLYEEYSQLLMNSEGDQIPMLSFAESLLV